MTLEKTFILTFGKIFEFQDAHPQKRTQILAHNYKKNFRSQNITFYGIYGFYYLKNIKQVTLLLKNKSCNFCIIRDIIENVSYFVIFGVRRTQCQFTTSTQGTEQQFDSYI